MSEVKLAREEISQILQGLINSRNELKANEYKTLVDALRIFVNLDFYKNNNYQYITYERHNLRVLNNESFNFYSNVLVKLDLEIKSLSNVLKEARERGELKEYHNWVVSYDRLLDVTNKIRYECKETKRKKEIVNMS